MCVCVSLFAYVSGLSVYVHVSVCMCMWKWVYERVLDWLCKCVCLRVVVGVPIDNCMFVNVYLCVSMCVCDDGYLRRSLFSFSCVFEEKQSAD